MHIIKIISIPPPVQAKNIYVTTKKYEKNGQLNKNECNVQILSIFSF